jgi:hypothetical protein
MISVCWLKSAKQGGFQDLELLHNRFGAVNSGRKPEHFQYPGNAKMPFTGC